MAILWRSTTVLAVGVIAAACQTAGEGPIELSAPVAAAFDKYKQVKFPEKSFAVSQDGLEYKYVWCEHAACGASGSLAAEAIHLCDQDRRRYNSSDQPCRVLAIGNTVVWEGEVTVPDTVVAYRLNPAEGFRPRGPKQSVGAVLYVPGFDPDYNFPPDDNSVPTYVVSMHGSGWDAFKAVPNNEDIEGPLTHERAAEGVARHIARLRTAGYQKVAIAAQSFGSWVALVGGADGETWADANILAVPGCCGPKLIDG